MAHLELIREAYEPNTNQGAWDMSATKKAMNVKMAMNSKKAVAAIGSIGLVLTLSACGGSSAPVVKDSKALVETTVAKAQAAGAFGAALVTTDGSSFTLSAPTPMTPGHFASGQLPGQINDAISIAVTPKAALNLASMIVTASTPAGACADILDGDNGFTGAPQSALAAGSSTTVKWAISCPGKSGDALTFLISNNNVSLVQVTGKLA
jgi:hypothetical protein